MKRNKEFFLLATITILLVLMSFIYIRNINKDLEIVQNSYSGKNASVVNLAAPLNEELLRKIMLAGDYFPDEAYSNFAVSQLQIKLAKEKSLPNLGAINKRDLQVEAAEMEKNGGDWGRKRVKISQIMMGLDSVTLAREMSVPAIYPGVLKVSDKNTGISFYGKVNTAEDEDPNEQIFPAKGVLMKLTEEYSSSYKDSINDKILSDASINTLRSMDLDQLVISPTYFARTDEQGRYKFENLEAGKNYSITPIKLYKQYGSLRGAAEVIQDDHQFNFTERIHKLKIFDNSAYQKIKADEVLTVRTPDQFKKDFTKYIALFLLGFWFFHFSLRFKKSNSDQIILPLLLFISGTGLIILYSIQKPLSGEVYGNSMALYTFGVFLALSIATLFFSSQKIYNIIQWDWVKSLENKGVKFPKLFVNPNHLHSRGFLWLMLSISLMIMLLLFGTGPEGSGVKVNLGPIQVSEISKFLMVLFFAKYFTANIDYLRKIPNNWYLLKQNGWMLAFFAGLIGIYVALGDLGPAMVLCLTFLVFYSFAKNEFIPMIISGVGFGIILFISSKIFSGDKYIMAGVSATCCILVAAYSYLIKKKYESSFLLVILISAFTILEIIPMTQFQRLVDRNGMFRNMWENDLNGGDQIAQGVWSLASGGWTGQGLGNGYSNVMPAYHTDMIFQSIGEELGIIALISILFAFMLLLYRTMLSAKESGKTLLFYFIGGIGITTLVQLCVIIGGSLGLIPLTGISVPFLSKGNSSLMINLFFFGLIIILSNIKSTHREKDYVNATFTNINAFSILTFFAILTIFMGRLFWFQWNADENMIKPSLVLTKQGEYHFSENPRISIISRAMLAGNILDRNGKLLATSDRKTFLEVANEMEAKSEYLKNQFQKQKYSNQKRFYPYAENLVFWLGDVNNQLVTNKNLGYVAEFENLSKLRGFEVKNKNTEEREPTSEKYRESPFLPEEKRKSKLVQYDYSQFIPYLKAGIKSNKIEEFNKNVAKRNLNLSIDVDLNETLNDLIQTKEYEGYKVSIVAIKTDDGQVLASAMNPRPNYKDLRIISEFGKGNFNKLMKVYFRNKRYENYVADRDFGMTFPSIPGSAAKVITTSAFFKRYGTDSANVTYNVLASEAIASYETKFAGIVNFRDAIKKSSNVFFVKLMNEHSLHPELFELYQSVGINVDYKGGYFYNKPANYNSASVLQTWNNIIVQNRESYNFEKLLGTNKRYKSFYSAVAYGQHPMRVTPLQMARFYGAVANNGNLVPLQFLLNDSKEPTSENFKITKNTASDALLESYLETEDHSVKLTTATKVKVYGKTGSALRRWSSGKQTEKPTINEKYNDGWFVFYIKDTKYNAPVAFAIRIQSKGDSDQAVTLAKKMIENLKAAGKFFPTIAKAN